MRLSLKIAAAMTLLTALVLFVLGLVTIRREASLLEADIARDSRLVAETVASLLKHARSEPGDHALLLQAVDREEGEMSIRWLDAVAPAFTELPDDARVALERGRVSVVREDQGFRAHAPVLQAGQMIGSVQVFESMALRDAFVQRALTINAITLLLVIMLCGLAALALGRELVGARVDALVRLSHQIGGGQFVRLAPVGGHDELALLGAELNLMAAELDARRLQVNEESEARLRAVQQLRHADRLTTVGKLAAGMAHELGTPLNVISGRAGLIARRKDCDEDIVADAAIIRDQAARITRIVQRMLNFSRRADPAPERCDVGRLVAESVEVLAEMARKADVDVALELGDTDRGATVDRGQIQQAVTNLIINGIQAMPDGGRMTVSVRVSAEEDEGTLADREIHIAVRDSGQGIPAGVLPQLFDPFFTTKEPGQGTGLGLSVVHGIVEDHGGTVTVESEEGRGSMFVIHLPVRGPT